MDLDTFLPDHERDNKKLENRKAQKIVYITGYLLMIVFCWYEHDYYVAFVIGAMYVINFLLDWHWQVSQK